MNDKDYMKEDWFAVLKEEVEKNGTAKTAAKLRYSMTSISLILNGKYSGKPDRVAAKVREVFRKVMCPFENRRMDRTECIEPAAFRRLCVETLKWRENVLAAVLKRSPPPVLKRCLDLPRSNSRSQQNILAKMICCFVNI